MVRLSVLAAILTAISSVQAASWCQCLFNDGSHCCVVSGAGSCHDKCVDAVKPGGFNGGAVESLPVRCNASGKGFGISSITAQGLTQCRKSGLGFIA